MAEAGEKDGRVGVAMGEVEVDKGMNMSMAEGGGGEEAGFRVKAAEGEATAVAAGATGDLLMRAAEGEEEDRAVVAVVEDLALDSWAAAEEVVVVREK